MSSEYMNLEVLGYLFSNVQVIWAMLQWFNACLFRDENDLWSCFSEMILLFVYLGIKIPRVQVFVGIIQTLDASTGESLLGLSAVNLTFQGQTYAHVIGWYRTHKTTRSNPISCSVCVFHAPNHYSSSQQHWPTSIKTRLLMYLKIWPAILFNLHQ